MALEWLPIESAPKDGTAVTSDCGHVKWTEIPSDFFPGYDIAWYECYANGELKYEYENIQYSYPILANPTLWLKHKDTANPIKKYTTDKPLEKPLVPVGAQMLEILADENATKEERDMALATILEIVSVPLKGY